MRSQKIGRLLLSVQECQLAVSIRSGVTHSARLIPKIPAANAAAVRAKIAAFEYLEAAQLLWDADEIQFKNFVKGRFAKAQIPPGGIKGPIVSLGKLGRGCVITTNFDSVIEEVLGPGVLEAYMHGTQRGNKFVPHLIKGDRCILKLHGDSEDYDTYVFTLKQYNDSYGAPIDFDRPLPRALRQIFVSHSLLFLGCSLEDKTLELFKQVLDSKQFDIPEHFAISQSRRHTAPRRLKNLGYFH